MKVNIWHLEGYVGFHEPDSKSEYNLETTFAVSPHFSKEDIYKMLFAKHSGRVVVLDLTFVETREVVV